MLGHTDRVTSESGGITAVLPTFNRAMALRETMPRFLELEDIDELVVVDDGSTDGTAVLLEGLSADHPHLRVVRHATNQGLPTARNTGLGAVRTEWAVFLEDDCTVPRDYATELRRVAESAGADIVGAPWLHVDPVSFEESLAGGRSTPVDVIDFHTGVSRFPAGPIATPFLCALALIKRRVFQELTYDTGYRVNAWREETDFFLRAVEHGFSCVLTPTTASCQVRRWTGGTRGRMWYSEYWVIRNNWRFLRRHRSALAQHGVPSIEREQLGFTLSRLSGLCRHYAVVCRDRLARR